MQLDTKKLGEKFFFTKKVSGKNNNLEKFPKKTKKKKKFDTLKNNYLVSFCEHIQLNRLRIS